MKTEKIQQGKIGHVLKVLPILAAMILSVKQAAAQPYFMYWFAEAFGYGVHGGTRTLDFVVFFALFTSIIYLGAKSVFNQDGKSSRAVMVLSAALGMALTLALVANTQFSLALFFPFAKNLIFFIFFFILYMFLVKYGGMEKNKVWAFIAALIISFLIFNVGNCFISERAQGGTCTSTKMFEGMGKPFKAVGDWFGKTFESGKKGATDLADSVESGAKGVIEDVIPQSEEEKLKKQSCKELVKQAKNPDLLCQVKDVATDVYNMCSGDDKNPYSDITRWRIASQKCTEEYNAADTAGKKKLQKDYDKARTEYIYIQALAAKENEKYDEAINKFDEVITDKGSSPSIISSSKKLKKESEKLKNDKENADKIKSASDNIEAGKKARDDAKKNTNPSEKLGLYKKAIEEFTAAKTSAQEMNKGIVEVKK